MLVGMEASDTTPPAPGVDYAPRQSLTPRLGKGLLPAAASLYVPSLGQFIAGERRRAAAWFGAFLALVALTLFVTATPILFTGVIVLFPASLLFTIACVVDAFRVGRRSSRPMLRVPMLRHLACVGFIVAAVFLNPVRPIAMFVRANCVEAFVMPTSGMAPTLVPGDRFAAHKRIGEIKRWDVVTFESPQTPGQKWVQRVVGLPGETIELIDGDVRIDGVVAARPADVGPYQMPVRRPGNASRGNPLTLGADEYFVLGDNSAVSLDGRYWDNPAPGHQSGALPRDHIVGKVTTVYWPLGRWKRL
jgi:signal peptidase I